MLQLSDAVEEDGMGAAFPHNNLIGKNVLTREYGEMFFVYVPYSI